MKYVIQCPKCKRPAEIDKEKSVNGVKVYKQTCSTCGEKVKPMID